MNKMSDFVQKMGQVREAGLLKESNIPQGDPKRHLVDNKNSITNHLMAFKQVQGENAFVSEQKQTPNRPLNEEKKMMMIGGLQVVKELLEGDLTKEPQAILERVKTILGNF